MARNGGRVTIFSTSRINTGLGKLDDRTQTNKQTKSNSNEMINAKTDYYKTLAIEANQHHVNIIDYTRLD